MTKVTCPECGTLVDTKKDLGEGDMLDFWIDNDGIFHWTCMECDKEWLGDFEGKPHKKTETRT